MRFCSRQHFLKQKTADLQSRKRSSRLVDDDVGMEPETPESSDVDLPGEGAVEEKKEKKKMPSAHWDSNFGPLNH